MQLKVYQVVKPHNLRAKIETIEPISNHGESVIESLTNSIMDRLKLGQSDRSRTSLLGELRSQIRPN